MRFDQNWKAVRNGPNQPVELYDLATDESEAHNVAAAHPDRVTRALELMKSARVDSADFPMRGARAGGGNKKTGNKAPAADVPNAN
ncbi:hypothetical protein [Verrucomicrobium spinosum]|uniref:hypothetical protein n=1 Tax=Verrucomicrobium spinosum TaxID=2736 RepID=UPI000ACD9930|nr:hypothetical protein [Verrucomicrobium spinosum]